MVLDLIYITLALVTLALAALTSVRARRSGVPVPRLAWVFLALLVLVGVADTLIVTIGADAWIVEVLDIVVLALLAVLIYRFRIVADAFLSLSERERELREEKRRATMDKYGGLF